MKSKIWIVAGLLALAGFIMSSMFVAVNESSIAIVSQFGKVVKVKGDAGLLFKAPEPIQTLRILDKRQKMVALETMEHVTRDRRNLVLNSFLVWKISDAKKYLSSVRNDETAALRLKDLATAEIASALGSYFLSDILNSQKGGSKTDDIFIEVRKAVNQRAEEIFGINVMAIYPTRISFPQPVIADVYKRMAAERSRMAQTLIAEGEEEAAKVLAETDYQARQIVAAAVKESKVIEGQAEAEAAKLYSIPYELNPEIYKFLNSMDTYKAVIDKNTKMVLSTDTPFLKYLWKSPEVSNVVQ